MLRDVTCRIIDKHAPPEASLGFSAVRSTMTGGTEVGVRDFYAADFDVMFATRSLRLALLILAPTGFWAAFHYFMAAKHIIADQKRAIGYL